MDAQRSHRRPSKVGAAQEPPKSHLGEPKCGAEACSAERCRGVTERTPVTLTQYLCLLTEMQNTEELFYATAIANAPVASGAALSQNGT